jgi:drug/metabolite transporter (DMT)-like permease
VIAVFALGLGGAACLGFGFALQQHAAARAPRGDILTIRLLLDLIRVREWVIGIVLMVAGLVLGALALAHGDVTLVEPLTATNLVFALALSRWLTGQPLGRTGWAGVILIAFGVTVFIVAGQPSGGKPRIIAPTDLLLSVSIIGAAVVMVAVGKRMNATREAMMLALAAGLLYGLQDTLTRISGELARDHGIARMFVHWQPYTIVVLGVFGLVLVQSAFESASLRVSLPILTAAQPLAGIGCSMGLLGDHLRATPLALASEFVGLLTVVGGIVLLGTHPALPDDTGPAPKVKAS